MKNKSFLLLRATDLNAESPSFSAYLDSYQFGVDFQVLSGSPTATVVIEQTADGGYNWTNVATFTLDTNGSIETPAASPVMLDGNAVRARITARGGVGNAYISAWMK